MRMQGKTKHIYAEAERDIHKKLDDFLARFKAEDERRKKLVDAGEMAKAEYDSWRRGQVFRGKRWQALRDEIVDQIYGSNKTAARIMNDERRSVFIQNANRTAYELEKKTHGAVSFELYDSATVTRLMKKDRKLLPYAEIKKMKDGKYNRKKVNNALTQSIIQGESMDKLAGRIAEAVSSKNESLMYSFARTMMTGAQNAGRLEAMREARDMGIKLKKRWLATLDSHTRDTHRDLDGVSVDVDKPFVIDGKEIMFPGDPNADADLVVNCRCTLIYDYEDYPANIQRRDNETGEVIEWQTYREWEASKNTDQLSRFDSESVDPAYINPVNKITDKNKVYALAYDFTEDGYDGRPILVIDNGDGSYQALTGSHRIYAAREAGIDIPSKIIERNKAADMIENAVDDEERLEIAKKLYSKGEIDKETLMLLQKEDVQNLNENSVKDKAEKAQKWLEKQESEKAAIEEEEAKAAKKEEAEQKAREESPEMREYLEFRQAMIDKYGEEHMYSEMTDNEYEKLERLERIAYKGR